MKRQYTILLLCSVLLVSLMFLHDYKYDYNPVPMTTEQYVYDIIVVGSIYTAIIYALLYGLYRAFNFLIFKIAPPK
ncbi:MAG: hypothetical protein EOP56_17035 [Sphingobacteriales bacterium]|nr:MAG: hypothetical protein EOP56_17035 [Sphingobacteriales bacterium]